ncbi:MULTISPECIES: hypothetical protein [Pseudomonas fluorescens group]|uniref:hypothetical protein n=1 Tax=Pseudomonas fluorescens group TaxID=136843 RepID=UPI001FCE5FAF|nr:MULTISPECIES: hypothetical protein [Pseudomonas fluorescens group]
MVVDHDLTSPILAQLLGARLIAGRQQHPPGKTATPQTDHHFFSQFANAQDPNAQQSVSSVRSQWFKSMAITLFSN